MKSKKKLDVLVESYDTLKKLLSGGDKTLVDILDLMSTMTASFVDRLLSQKKKFKQEVRETGEKLRGELQTLETQLFTTKVETETLKIDKKYFEDQVSELQKKNQEMISNIENIMSDPKRQAPLGAGGALPFEKRPSDPLLP
jgi:predicted nuclease with TOPRIM domain